MLNRFNLLWKSFCERRNFHRFTCTKTPKWRLAKDGYNVYTCTCLSWQPLLDGILFLGVYQLVVKLNKSLFNCYYYSLGLVMY